MRVTLLLLTLISVISAKLNIIGPEKLKALFKGSNQTIDVVYANFGRIPYGQSMLGHLHYNNSNQLGCNKDHTFFNEQLHHKNGTEMVHDHEHNHDHSNNFVLMERGDCHFVTKVRNAALNGAKLAIIIDNKNEDINGVIMADDGTGAGIGIPSILIGNFDGQIIKNFLKSANATELQNIKFNIEFNAPVKGNTVYVDLWYTQSDRKTMNFVIGLGTLLKTIMDDIYFTPRFVTYACEKCTFTFKQENCVSDGKYCATSHMNAANQNDGHNNEVTGRDILLEYIRQYELNFRLQRPHKYDFFKYLKFVNDMCGNRITKKCHDLGFKDIDQDVDEFKKTVDQTFEHHGDYDSVSLVFQSENAQRQRAGLHIYPAVMINEQIFRGQMNPDNVFQAICASFRDMPAGCYEWEDKVGIKLPKQGGVSSYELMVIIGLLVTLNICLALAYRSFLQTELKKDMKIQVSSAVSQYVALSTIPELNDEKKDDELK